MGDVNFWVSVVSLSLKRILGYESIMIGFYKYVSVFDF